MKTLLQKEQALSKWFNAGCLILLATGLYFFFEESHSDFKQATALLHIVLGLILCFFLPLYIAIHFRRTIGFRRPSTIVLGILALAGLLVAFASGIHSSIIGSEESKGWIYDAHWWGVLAFVIFLIAHLAVHKLTYPEKRSSTSGRYFESLSKVPAGIAAISSLTILFVGLTVSINSLMLKPNSGEPFVKNYDYSYGAHPFWPSQTETVSNQFVEPRFIGNSAQCATCHSDISNQWFASAHREAASDKSYETNVSLLAEKKGIAATRYCEGCHAPVALLSGSLSEGGIHGGIVGSEANLEGVGCLGCHGIKQVLNTKGVASYQFGISSPYLFEHSQNPILREINHTSIRINPSQHKKDMLNVSMQDSSFCATCHAQFMDESMNGWGWVQMQDEYAAWLKSNYSGHHDPEFVESKVMHCQDCHMAKIAAVDPSADDNGLISDHRFLAANTMLPLLRDDKEHLDATIRFLQANRISIGIDKPYRNDATRNDLALDESLRKQAIQPFYFYKGEEAKINIVVSNIGVGHDFPGGTVDINEAWLAITVKDASGDTIYEKGIIPAEEVLPSDVYAFRSLPVDREGKHVWKHDLFNMIGEVSKNTIPAGGSDVVEIKFEIPHWVRGPISVNAILKYRKLNVPYAKWALKDEYQAIPIVDMAKDFLSIPVRDEFEVY